MLHYKTDSLPLFCLWCGKETNRNEDLKQQEHIFPEAIGGKDKLYPGAVCHTCNNRLSILDNRLKRGHPMMMYAYQIDENIKGKKTSDKVKKYRRKQEKYSISSQIKENQFHIIRDDGKVNFYDINFCEFSENFSRSLHKCVANILCERYGSVMTRVRYPQLIDFVDKGGNAESWRYALSMPKYPFHVRISEPIVMEVLSLNSSLSPDMIIALAHTSGIWVLGTQPGLLTEDVVKAVSDRIIIDTVSKQDPRNVFVGTVFLKDCVHSGFIGDLNFVLVPSK